MWSFHCQLTICLCFLLFFEELNGVANCKLFGGSQTTRQRLDFSNGYSLHRHYSLKLGSFRGILKQNLLDNHSSYFLSHFFLTSVKYFYKMEFFICILWYDILTLWLVPSHFVFDCFKRIIEFWKRENLIIIPLASRIFHFDVIVLPHTFLNSLIKM